jgi:peptidoglycan/xylan/chitin deacetylase (PgdA/CDA1 family)
LWIGSTGVLGLLGAGVAVAAMLLWEHIDIRQLTPGLVQAHTPPQADSPVPAAAAPVRFSAVVLNSARNRAYFPAAGYYERELDTWRELLRNTGATVRDVHDAASLRSLAPTDVLVLPEAPCLSAPELAAIHAHRRAGGSVVANWAVGARDEACEWRGWETLIDLTAAEDVREIPARPSLFVTIPSGIPLASRFDPGTRLELRPEASLALRTQGARVYWSDWALNPQPDGTGGGADVAALATRDAQGSRTAWFGFRLGQAATARDSAGLQRLLENGVLWAAGIPTATVSAWPGGARAAMMFIIDVEDQAHTARQISTFLRALRVPASYYAVTRLVGEDAALWRELGEGGEVGSHTVDHKRLAGLTLQDQTIRLRRSRDDIERALGKPAPGLRPPEEAFDSLTLVAWHNAGGDYILVGYGGRSAVPEVHTLANGSIILIPRLLKDDYNTIVMDHAVRAERITEAFVAGAQKLRAIGGVAVMAGHTQIMNTNRRLDAFRVVAESARAQRDWWFARGDQMARWWRARVGTRLSFESPGGKIPPGLSRSGIDDLVVTAPAEAPLESAWIDIVIPSARRGFVPLLNGHPVEFALTDWGIRVPLAPVPAGAEVRIALARADSTVHPGQR